MIFELISRKFQFKFKDRIAAADILGESLKDRVKKEEEQKTAVSVYLDKTFGRWYDDIRYDT